MLLHAFIWTEDGGLVDIPDASNLECLQSYAREINDRGQVVGAIEPGRGLPRYAFLYDSSSGDIQNLCANSSFISAYALSINNKGQVVGFGTVIQTP